MVCYAGMDNIIEFVLYGGVCIYDTARLSVLRKCMSSHAAAKNRMCRAATPQFLICFYELIDSGV